MIEFESDSDLGCAALVGVCLVVTTDSGDTVLYGREAVDFATIGEPRKEFESVAGSSLDPLSSKVRMGLIDTCKLCVAGIEEFAMCSPRAEVVIDLSKIGVAT